MLDRMSPTAQARVRSEVCDNPDHLLGPELDTKNEDLVTIRRAVLGAVP